MAARLEDQGRAAQIRSYDFSVRMQLASPEALNVKDEPAQVLRLCSLDGGPKTWPKEINAKEESSYFAQKCPAARRLLERSAFHPDLKRKRQRLYTAQLALE